MRNDRAPARSRYRQPLAGVDGDERAALLDTITTFRPRSWTRGGTFEKIPLDHSERVRGVVCDCQSLVVCRFTARQSACDSVRDHLGSAQGIGFETIREIDVNSWTRRQEAQSRIGREAGTILTVARHVTDS